MPTDVFSSNKSVVTILTFNKRDNLISYHVVRWAVMKNDMRLYLEVGKDNLEDLLTKTWERIKYSLLRSCIMW